MSDVDRYNEKMISKEVDWEALCRNCGACCGSVEGDPCENLSKKEDGTYYCIVYENRFGNHKTVSGNKLKCVPISNIIMNYWPGDNTCPYKH